MESFTLDSLPVLRFFRRQPGWEIIDRILEDARIAGKRLPMSAINWGEVYYTILRDEGRETLEIVNSRISRSAIEIVVPTIENIRQAAEMKARGGISYADCFAGALALERDLPILTDDIEFELLIPFGVKIEWLPPNV